MNKFDILFFPFYFFSIFSIFFSFFYMFSFIWFFYYPFTILFIRFSLPNILSSLFFIFICFFASFSLDFAFLAYHVSTTEGFARNWPFRMRDVRSRKQRKAWKRLTISVVAETVGSILVTWIVILIEYSLWLSTSSRSTREEFVLRRRITANVIICCISRNRKGRGKKKGRTSTVQFGFFAW